MAILGIAFGFIALMRFTAEHRTETRSASSSGATQALRSDPEKALSAAKINASRSIAAIHVRRGDEVVTISGICVKGGIVTAADSVSLVGLEVTASTDARPNAEQHSVSVRSVDEVSGLAYLTGYQCPEAPLSMKQTEQWHEGQPILMAAAPYAQKISAPLRAQVFQESGVLTKTQFGRTGDAILLPIFGSPPRKTSPVIGSNAIGTALMNMKGKFMGVVIARVNGSYFAIPSAIARRVIGQFIRAENVEGGWLGVELDAKGEVLEVSPNSPAQSAGIVAGETIYASEGALTVGLETLLTSLQSHAPGDRFALTIERQGRTRDVIVILGSRPSDYE
jgi:hypothetical protein